MHPTSSSPKPNGFDSIASTIEAFKRGEFIVVLDDQDRENEGDLIIAAEDMTTEKMAFMVRWTSGLICAPLTSRLARDLELPQMVTDNEDPNRTAYTISVDASHESVSTGISAHDRALTCRTLANTKAKPSDLRRPGHVFPLRARDGGVLERTGHTEAAVEFCRLAGKAPVGVICEMIEDGVAIDGQAAMSEPGMMRRDACLAFGKKWGLKTCTIEDLVDYVRNVEGKKAVSNGVPSVNVHADGAAADSAVNGAH
ncbi:3,4-dihydroxy-2-butanone 4-phosphate synthase [Exophiala mesophila]|uniref:3,4-dihydroxy-2-butanone 4-phosphate synthase n=1 Tax=Exophiala mesophila TaxID=212818 RepID=A0A438NK13_EXOME|nr:3,4-dihydroxy-2-butanone 4-phosphate synthase [Exophiala mesophila]